MSAIKKWMELAYGDALGLPIVGPLDDQRLLSASVTMEGGKYAEEMISCIASLKSYNEFRGAKVAAALRKLNKEDLVRRLAFGRECSPCLEVFVRLGRLEGKAGKSLPAEMACLGSLKADAIEVKTYNQIGDESGKEYVKSVYLWWD